jgi:hypothetical protein
VWQEYAQLLQSRVVVVTFLTWLERFCSHNFTYTRLLPIRSGRQATGLAQSAVLKITQTDQASLASGQHTSHSGCLTLKVSVLAVTDPFGQQYDALTTCQVSDNFSSWVQAHLIAESWTRTETFR